MKLSPESYFMNTIYYSVQFENKNTILFTFNMSLDMNTFIMICINLFKFCLSVKITNFGLETINTNIETPKRKLFYKKPSKKRKIQGLIKKNEKKFYV